MICPFKLILEILYQWDWPLKIILWNSTYPVSMIWPFKLILKNPYPWDLFLLNLGHYKLLEFVLLKQSLKFCIPGICPYKSVLEILHPCDLSLSINPGNSLGFVPLNKSWKYYIPGICFSKLIPEILQSWDLSLQVNPGNSALLGFNINPLKQSF